jgi:hypothetical protein
MQATALRLGVAALALLVVGLALGWSPLVALAIALAGGTYAAELAIDDAPLDRLTPALAALVLVAAELAYWSLDERDTVADEEGGTARHLAFVVLLALGALFIGALLLALVDVVQTRSLATDVLGAIAAAAVLFAILTVGRRRA